MANYGKFGALTLGALTLVATPLMVAAAHADDDIIVNPPAAMSAWTAQANKRLDRALATDSSNFDTHNTIVQISFTRGADGRPADVSFYNNEGTGAERQIARRAVMRLDNLNQAPVQQAGDVHFLASLIFADDAHSLKQLRTRLAGMEQKRLASNDASRTYIALGY